MRTSRKIKALVGLGVGSSSLILLLIIASLLPTSVARVSSAQSAVVVVGKRQKIAGCALTQIGDGDAIPCSDAIPTSIDEEEIQFPTQITHSNIQQLAGTLHIPRGLPSPRPGVVLIHGSGPNSRDSTSTGGLIVKHEAYPVFGALAAQLAEQGLVVLRYDKRSCGTCYPNAKWDSAAFEFSDFEADARDAVRYLAGRAETDDHNIVVIGHSQGGRLAPFVATDNKHVAVVVMLSGTTQSFEQGLIGQTKRIEAYRLQQLDVFNTLSLWWVRRGWQACFDDLRDDYQPDEECLGSGVTQRALKNYEQYNAATTDRIRALDVPWLALQGTADINIDPAVIKQLAELARERDAEAHYIEGVGHSLVNGLTPATPVTIDQELSRVVREFLGSVARRRP